MRNNFLVDERAYVTTEDIRIAEPPTIGHYLAGEILLRNTGKTPAIHCQTWRKIDVLPSEPSPADWGSLARQQGPHREIGAGLSHSMSVKGDNPLSPEWFGKLNSGYKLYVFGAVVYRDVFGREWETDACGFYNPKQMPNAKSDTDLFLYACNGDDSNRMR